MSRVFLTSDTHFGHRNILNFSERGKLWSNVDEMDAGLIELWNAVVRPEDVVWHLGDVTWHPKRESNQLDRLNGTIHLVVGNHDHKDIRKHARFASVHDMYDLKLPDGNMATLCHYRMMVWKRSHHGALHFYGHSHGSLPGTSQCCDVGIDCPQWGYSPVLLEDAIAHLATLPPHSEFDYHAGLNR